MLTITKSHNPNLTELSLMFADSFKKDGFYAVAASDGSLRLMDFTFEFKNDTVIARRLKLVINSNLELSDIRALIVRFMLENVNVTTDNAVEEMIQQHGIKDNLKGYDYLIEAVHMALADHRLKGSFTNTIYPIIAERFETSANAVERSIRYAIDIAYRDREDWLDKPSPSELIWHITNEIKRKYSALLDMKESDENV